MDQSHLDSRYFIDEHVFNCPFCNRRNVQYRLFKGHSFDWDNQKTCHVYYAACTSCTKTSMHLTFEEIPAQRLQRAWNGRTLYRFDTGEDGIDLSDRRIDNLFFYSVPTSFYVVDDRIPRTLRELITEAEGCLKSNFLTGASACARKVIYELAELQGADGENYDERIKSLKSKNPEVDSTYFDTLLTIQQVTSSKVHEQAYDGWESKHLRLILSSLIEILNEIFVIPAEREERRKEVLRMKSEVIPDESREGSSEATVSTEEVEYVGVGQIGNRMNRVHR